MRCGGGLSLLRCWLLFLFSPHSTWQLARTRQLARFESGLILEALSSSARSTHGMTRRLSSSAACLFGPRSPQSRRLRTACRTCRMVGWASYPAQLRTECSAGPLDATGDAMSAAARDGSQQCDCERRARRDSAHWYNTSDRASSRPFTVFGKAALNRQRMESTIWIFLR